MHLYPTCTLKYKFQLKSQEVIVHKIIMSDSK